MYMKKLVYFSMAVLLFACSKKADDTGTGVVTPPPPPPPASTVIAPPPSLGFVVVGYFPSYTAISGVADTKFKMCNVVCYAFASVNSTGGVDVENPSVLAAVRTKSRNNNAKLFISLAGSTTDWKNMASTAAGRTNYIKKVMDIVRTYQLDGVDVDWEFPSTSDGTDVTYTSLMKELSDSCHMGSKYYLTAALTAGKYVGAYTNAIKTELLTGTYVDFFNIMAYDDFNTTVPYRHHSNYTLAEVCLNYWITTRGTPKSKIVLGLPAYARPSGITQSGTILSYSAVLGQAGIAAAQTDSATVSVTGYTNYKIYYNGQPTIKKKTMLAKNTAGGVMMWQLGQDTNDGYSLLKAACDTIGRAY